MAGEVHVQIRVDWLEVEPDGRACSCCGDACYLTMALMQFWAGNQPCRMHEPRFAVCGSCLDVVKDSEG